MNIDMIRAYITGLGAACQTTCVDSAVPSAYPLSMAAAPTEAPTVATAADLLRGLRIAVLTGAGISTESGIPDYRGPEKRFRPATPVTFQEFVRSAEARKRYWARSAAGWPWMRERRPNAAHHAVVALERSGATSGLITQNVDGLHAAAGSRRVVELHGALRSVMCLACAAPESRDAFQERLLSLNPGWLSRSGEVAPDGDVHLEDGATQSFVVPGCARCGGVVKPGVVFFGESVPREVVLDAFAILGGAQALLVAGSSLTVFSGYRFVDSAVRDRKPVVLINEGPTRADPVATLKVEARLGDALPRLAGLLVAL